MTSFFHPNIKICWITCTKGKKKRKKKISKISFVHFLSFFLFFFQLFRYRMTYSCRITFCRFTRARISKKKIHVTNVASNATLATSHHERYTPYHIFIDHISRYAEITLLYCYNLPHYTIVVIYKSSISTMRHK